MLKKVCTYKKSLVKSFFKIEILKLLKVLVNISDPKKIVEKPDEKEQGYDPMRRAPYMFGGVIRDWKKRFPLKVYWSDIKDGLDGQVFAAAIFIFFACLSGAIGK